MANELILMPLRIGIRVANVCLRPVASVAEELLSLAGRLRDTNDRHEGHSERAADDPHEGHGERSAEPAAGAPAPSAPARQSVTSATVEADPRGVETEPPHVSEEPELVTELAEPGAEEGAGAELRVDEPWPEYRQLTANQVIERLKASSPEELAVVELYERSTRQRPSVISAVERELKRAAAGRSAS